MAYEGKCGSCGYFEYEAGDTKGYCEWFKCYYYPNDTCSHQKQMETTSSSTCYITTIVCNKLCLEDDCGVLNTLRGFRDNIMQQNPKYCKILFEYDVIGPKISKMIKDDRDTDQELWMQFYNFYLLPTSSLVKEEKYDEAVERYKEMVNALKEYYGIKEDITEITKDYDITKGGHGVVKYIHP